MQPAVDEFISNLEALASGSYLREEDRTFWEQPFDPAALPNLRAILEGYLDTLDAAQDEAGAQRATATFIEQVEEFNAGHAGAVVEQEEIEELNGLIRGAVPQEFQENLPLFE